MQNTSMFNQSSEPIKLLKTARQCREEKEKHTFQECFSSGRSQRRRHPLRNSVQYVVSHSQWQAAMDTRQGLFHEAKLQP